MTVGEICDVLVVITQKKADADDGTKKNRACLVG